MPRPATPTTPVVADEFPITRARGASWRDFTRYLLTAGVFAAGTVGAAAGRPSAVGRGRTPTDRGSADVPESTEYLFRYPTEEDPAILVHLEEERAA